MLNVGNYLDNYLIIATSAGKLGRNGGDNRTYKSVEAETKLGFVVVRSSLRLAFPTSSWPCQEVAVTQTERLPSPL